VRLLVFNTDAFGGFGGIAKYNRDLLTCLCSFPGVRDVVVLPRLAPSTTGVLPEGLRLRTGAHGGKLRYGLASMRELATFRGFDAVVCSHIHLLPFAYVAAKRFRCPLVLFIYGIDAWEPSRRREVRAFAHRVDAVVSISRETLDRFRRWAPVPENRCHVLPNAFTQEDFSAGPKSPELVARYGLEGKRVLMTLGRMAATERYKGFDEVLEQLPWLLEREPYLAYLVVGDGTDRPRLEAKAAGLGLPGRIVFTGRIPEEEKADHYRLADVYVMPSYGEGFGFVFLEAMACGIPVVASKVDGSREAVRDGLLGELVDPADPVQVREGILAALAKPRGVVPDGLSYFAFERFEERTHAFLRGFTVRDSPGSHRRVGAL
jgi:glycosyltransferase involved in cell wall biosynthesis